VSSTDPALVVGRLSVALSRLTRWLRRGDTSGLGPGTIGALATVSRSGPIRLGDLAAREDMTPPTLTRVVALLEEQHLVFKGLDPADRRATLVTITPHGQELMDRLVRARMDRLSERVAALDPEQREILARAVPVLEALAAQS
jgi:DNA-binding MarR family transcriptional regulator